MDLSESHIFLITGSTGAGKTTYARVLADQIGGIRFSIDDWMTTLFWMDSPEPISFDWSIERVNRCEAMLDAESAAYDAAQSGITLYDRGFPDIAGFFIVGGLPIPYEVHAACQDLRYNGPIFRTPPGPLFMHKMPNVFRLLIRLSPAMRLSVLHGVPMVMTYLICSLCLYRIACASFRVI